MPANKHHIRAFALKQRRPSFRQVAPNPQARFAAKRHQALLTAFAIDHPHYSFVQTERNRFQGYDLGNPQAAGIHEFQHRSIAQTQRGIHIRRIQ